MSRKAILSLVAILSLGSFVTASVAAAQPGWKPGQKARQETYNACKARLQKDPPCNNVWTKYCARQCGAKYL